MNRMNQNDKDFIVGEIRARYTEKKDTPLDELCRLDRKIRRPAEIVAYTVGTLSALLLGSGMSLVMTDIGAVLGIGAPMVPGIILGTIGLVGVALNFPIFKKWQEKRMAARRDEILSLSEKV